MPRHSFFLSLSRLFFLRTICQFGGTFVRASYGVLYGNGDFVRINWIGYSQWMIGLERVCNVYEESS